MMILRKNRGKRWEQRIIGWSDFPIFIGLSHRGNLEKWTNFIAQINWMRRQSEVNQHRSCLQRVEILLIKNALTPSGWMEESFLLIRNRLSGLYDGIISGHAMPSKRLGTADVHEGWNSGGSGWKSLNNWKFVRKLCYDLSAELLEGFKRVFICCIGMFFIIDQRMDHRDWYGWYHMHSHRFLVLLL